MGLARKAARKLEKKAHAGEKRTKARNEKAKASVKEAYVKEYIRGKLTRKQALRDLSACFLLAMHDHYKFGRGKLERLRDKMQSELDAIVAGNISIEEVAEFLQDEIGLCIGVAEDEQKASRCEQIKFKAVQEMSIAFLMALLDEFDFKKERLANAYWYVAELSDRVTKKETSYPEIHRRLTEIMARPVKSPLGRFNAVTHTRTKAKA